MSPRPSRAAERRPQILSAAARVIAVRGLEGTRLSDVAEEAGVSVGAIQHYFRTRDRLLEEVFAYERRQGVDRWLGADGDEPDAWRRLLSLVEHVVRDPPAFRERWGRWLEFWAACARDPGLRREMGDLYERWREPIRRAIEDGIASGRFQPELRVDDLVDRAVAAFDGLALQVLLDVPRMSLGRMRDLLVAGLADDLRLGEAGGPRRSRGALR